MPRKPKKPIDLTKVREVDAKVAKFLAKHPEMGEANPESKQVLRAWLEENLQEDSDDGTAEEIR